MTSRDGLRACGDGSRARSRSVRPAKRERDAYRATSRRARAVCASSVASARSSESWERGRTGAGRRMLGARSALDARRAGESRATRWALADGACCAGGCFHVGLRAAATPRPVTPAQHAMSAHEARALAALGTQTAPRREGRAESLAVGAPATFSTAFDVTVDGRGMPVRCSITKSSGDRALDQSVCRAAMRAHYTPQPPTVPFTQ